MLSNSLFFVHEHFLTILIFWFESHSSFPIPPCSNAIFFFIWITEGKCQIGRRIGPLFLKSVAWYVGQSKIMPLYSLVRPHFQTPAKLFHRIFTIIFSTNNFLLLSFVFIWKKSLAKNGQEPSFDNWFGNLTAFFWRIDSGNSELDEYALFVRTFTNLCFAISRHADKDSVRN